MLLPRDPHEREKNISLCKKETLGIRIPKHVYCRKPHASALSSAAIEAVLKEKASSWPVAFWASFLKRDHRATQFSSISIRLVDQQLGSRFFSFAWAS
jgi:hypothetical protein